MQLSGKTFLVTGGAGLIGSTIVDQLLAVDESVQVVVVDNLTRGTLFNLENAMATGRVRLVEADIRHFDQIRPLFDDVQGVFHQAAIRITRCSQEPRECLEVLIDGTFNVVQACVEANVEKIVAASSASVYGLADQFPTTEQHHLYNNRTWYGAAKIANEAMLRSFNEMYGLNYVMLRYFNVYGPRMDVFGKYTEVLIRWLDLLDRRESPKIFGDGKQTMDFVYSEDIARANLLAMQSDVSDRVFNVASGTEISLLELLQALLQVTGNEDITPEFLPERSVNPVQRRLADITQARDDLGFVAEVGIEEGLQRLIEWRRETLVKGQREAYDGPISLEK
ncbi:NAD-dependent epimerase/dehydratase family protein [Bremerella sp. JC770]|uniref:NAD-dependent epimerase/dehydratase family protein n=1 Tax=Bremerella sp. JC770 TaxID=3232137 RepID=UPI003459F459